MGEEGRIGTVDLIIRVLTEHERTFDSLLTHLDSSIDRIDIQRIEAKLKTEKQENDSVLVLVDRIADLEKQVEKYKDKIKQLELQTIRIKNSVHNNT